MKATGIIRRIDSLGRVVIPKEIRKSLRIIENDMLEISLQNDLITLKKVSSFSDSIVELESLFKLITKLYKFDLFITDNSTVVLYLGDNKENYIGKNISEFLVNGLQKRQIMEYNYNTSLQIIEENNKEVEVNNYLLIPIINSGDIYGILGIMNYGNANEIIKIGNIIEKILQFKTNEI